AARSLRVAAQRHHPLRSRPPAKRSGLPQAAHRQPTVQLLSSGMPPKNDNRPLRVLVVDDSAYNRQTTTSMLESRDNVEVVGRATNGKEALKLAFDLDPDVITLDLEMPEMDGFSFLRL